MSFEPSQQQAPPSKGGFHEQMETARKKLGYMKVVNGNVSKSSYLYITGLSKKFDPTKDKVFDSEFCYVPAFRLAGKRNDVYHFLLAAHIVPDAQSAKSVIDNGSYHFTALRNPQSTIKLRDPNDAKKTIVVNMQQALADEVAQYKLLGAGKAGTRPNMANLFALVAKFDGKSGSLFGKGRGTSRDASIVERLATAILKNQFIDVSEFKGTLKDELVSKLPYVPMPATQSRKFARVDPTNSIPELSRVVFDARSGDASKPYAKSIHAQNAANFLARYFREARGEEKDPKMYFDYLITFNAGATPIPANYIPEMSPKVQEAFRAIQVQQQPSYQQASFQAPAPFPQQQQQAFQPQQQVFQPQQQAFQPQQQQVFQPQQQQVFQPQQQQQQFQAPPQASVFPPVAASGQPKTPANAQSPPKSPLKSPSKKGVPNFGVPTGSPQQ
jgi:hypothetical protein